MKRWFAAILMIALLCTQVALAAKLPDLSSYSDLELAALSDALSAEMAKRDSAAEASSDEDSEGVETEVLEQGSKGKAVKELQLRLIELNYLSGSADGAYGGKTKSAVEQFQQAAGLPVDGIADEDTLTAIYASNAPAAKVYLELDFTAISRDPDNYKGKDYSFTGNVLQVLEEAADGFTYVAMRVATRGNYDDVVYVTYRRGEGESRILEDDNVTVNGTCQGLYTYETVIGGSVTLPQFTASSVTLN